MEFICYDTETTGLEKCNPDELYKPKPLGSCGCEVIQIGGLMFNEKLEVQRMFCFYCDTVYAESTKDALKVHKLSMKDLRPRVSCQFLPVIMHTYLPEFFYKDVIFIGYNIEYDMMAVTQTLANTPGSFSWNIYNGNIAPRKGRYCIDVASFVRKAGKYQKLASFDEELSGARNAFLHSRANLSVDTNCLDLLQESWEKKHNAFYDALNTYLLWGDRVWGTKVI